MIHVWYSMSHRNKILLSFTSIGVIFATWGSLFFSLHIFVLTARRSRKNFLIQPLFLSSMMGKWMPNWQNFFCNSKVAICKVLWPKGTSFQKEVSCWRQTSVNHQGMCKGILAPKPRFDFAILIYCSLNSIGFLSDCFVCIIYNAA